MCSSKSAEFDPAKDMAIVMNMRAAMPKKKWREFVKRSHEIVKGALGKKAYRLAVKLASQGSLKDESIVGLSLQIARLAAAHGKHFPGLSAALKAADKFAPPETPPETTLQ